jgi:hypothetical protein
LFFFLSVRIEQDLIQTIGLFKIKTEQEHRSRFPIWNRKTAVELNRMKTVNEKDRRRRKVNALTKHPLIYIVLNLTLLSFLRWR